MYMYIYGHQLMVLNKAKVAIIQHWLVLQLDLKSPNILLARDNTGV